jgi:DNA topoisomerase III
MLRAAAPALVDPGTTAIWEMRLDDVVVGKANFRAVIDEIAGEANRLITVLRQHNGGTVDLSEPAPIRARRGRSPARGKRHTRDHATAASEETKPKSQHRRKAKNASHQVIGQRRQDHGAEPKQRTSARASPPTTKMVAFAQRLAKDKKAKLPPGYDKDFEICRRFLDQQTGR